MRRWLWVVWLLGLCLAREGMASSLSVRFINAPLDQVLLELAHRTQLNVVLAEPNSSPVSIEVNDQSMASVLELIATLQGLEVREISGVWVIGSREYWARLDEAQALIGRHWVLKHRNVEDIVPFIAPMLSPRGHHQVDASTNGVWIEDTDEIIERVNHRLLALDQPAPQVLIESRIVVASRDFNRALGMRFGLGAQQEAITDGNQGSVSVNLPAAGASGQLNVALLSARYRLDAELSALEASGRGRVISTPRIMVANRAEAFIQQGVAVPFEAVQGGDGAGSGAVSVQFREAALALRASPLILADGRIQLDLEITQDTVGQIFQTGRGGSVPSIDTRQLGTRVWVNDGQTLVLGGIFQEQDAKLLASVPGLSSIPGIGRLFQKHSHDDQRRELLIFITPTLLN